MCTEITEILNEYSLLHPSNRNVVVNVVLRRLRGESSSGGRVETPPSVLCPCITLRLQSAGVS